MHYTMYFKPIILSLSIVLGLSMCVLPTVVAQEEADQGATTSEAKTDEETGAMEEAEAPVRLEGLVVVGTRSQPRSVLDSAVPIDIVSGQAFEKQAGADLPNLLRSLVPSYNVNTQPISDASTVVRPANLRGLAPDHTLVLVNNKRRHRAAVIHWLGNGISDGAQGADLSAIPAIALKQVEVLRDGASAQYGSDAIAGVLNFQLKDNYEGGSFQFKPGIYQYGDGRQYSVAGNIGLGSPNAWTNLSVEYGGSNPTSRSVQWSKAEALINAGNTDVRDPVQIWGQPIIDNDFKFFANYGSTFTDTIDFYGHANYASKRVEGGFYFRHPNERPHVFGVVRDGEQYLLVGNLAGTEDPNADDILVTDNVPDPVALQAVKDDPNLFSFQEMFPGGFTPRFGAYTNDASVLVGVKGAALGEALAKPLTWDLSGYFGRHEADYFIFNTVNASLGPETPTEFDPGAYIQTEYNLNFDVTYPLTDMVFLASGLEYRNEGFEVVEGQRESYQIGPLAEQGFSSASNGFSGFGRIASGTWDRSNVAAYLESEIRPFESLLLALAVRGENFETFGGTLNYKAAANYKVMETLRLRGGYSSGFRAPTPGQQNTFNVSTVYDFTLGALVNRGIIPSTHSAAALHGGDVLEPEKSNNFTGGFTFEVMDVNLTMDLFDIRLRDRLGLTEDITLSDEDKENLVSEGITSAKNLQKFRFFTNDFDTTTQGIDVVVTAPVANGNVIAVYNYTTTTVTNVADTLAFDDRKNELEKGLPKHRASLTATQSITNRWGVLARASYFSGWFDSEDFNQNPEMPGVGEYSGKVVVDLETQYMADSGLTITIGGNNILDQYPDENPNQTVIGNQYGQFSPFGFDGAFWYARFGYSF